jgi:predicted DNA-binding antitoxin AbrB/MazE fold protein
MTARFTAIVDHGLLRPTVPVELEEGATVEVVVVSRPTENGDANPAEILANLAKLAALSGDPTTGREHDRVIYGSELGK